MSGTLFYLGDVLAPGTFEATIMTAQVVKAVIGIVIAYIAYRGYRENESEPMKYLALGFILVLGVPFALYFGGVALLAVIGIPTIGQAAIVAIAELSQVAGLGAILHALRM